MINPERGKVKCQICLKDMQLSEVVTSSSLSRPILQTIIQEHPEWSNDGYICYMDLNHFRTEHIREILGQERGELSELETEVAKSLEQQEILSSNINNEFKTKLSMGDRVADKVASFGGSWRFISIFAITMVIWITFNSIALLTKPFDPFPYILLNLLLSCLAAIQAPVIMMSQNRQESKDRLRSEHDYKINLKAELEIRHLNEKLDHLINRQWQDLLETQEIQLQMLEELTNGNRIKPRQQ